MGHKKKRPSVGRLTLTGEGATREPDSIPQTVLCGRPPRRFLPALGRSAGTAHIPSYPPHVPTSSPLSTTRQTPHCTSRIPAALAGATSAVPAPLTLGMLLEGCCIALPSYLEPLEFSSFPYSFAPFRERLRLCLLYTSARSACQ